MKKYLVTYNAPTASEEQMSNSTPEQQEEGMKAWMNWANQHSENIVDLGTPLGSANTINSKGDTQTNSQARGYSIIQANSLEEAKQMFSNHPHTAWDEACCIDIHEMQQIPGMENQNEPQA